jgi:hypothetical protein
MNGNYESKRPRERGERVAPLNSGDSNTSRDSVAQHETEEVNEIKGALKIMNNLCRKIKDLVDRNTFRDEVPEGIVKENLLRSLFMVYLLTVSMVGESVLARFLRQPFESEGQPIKAENETVEEPNLMQGTAKKNKRSRG